LSAESPERLLWFPLVSRKDAHASSGNQVRDELTPASDERLLHLAKAGDLGAVGILFDRYSRLVLGVGYRILHDRGEAEDLVQEVFLRLCKKSNSFDASKGSARTWLVQFAYRRAFDRRRYLTRRCFYVGTNLDCLKNALQEGLGLEAEVAARVTGEQLRVAFEELNDKQSATLQLYFFEGLDLREAATRLGETLENTRHYYYRGLERLRRTAIALTLRSEK
jgi:RNA polymerase sigma-70 factor (ECF subfamily)